MARVRIEFTVEPFVEGHPGPHVLAAIDAVTERGVQVDVGPFSTVADVEVDQAASTVAALLQAALDRGATRLAVQLGGVALADSGLHGALPRMIEQVEAELGGRLSDLSREDKQRAVRILDDRGAFLLRRSVDEVADALGVSRITVYNYLNAVRP
jgi:uncharacterized protein YqgV (UPF0045/DUF77 family)